MEYLKCDILLGRAQRGSGNPPAGQCQEHVVQGEKTLKEPQSFSRTSLNEAVAWAQVYKKQEIELIFPSR